MGLTCVGGVEERGGVGSAGAGGCGRVRQGELGAQECRAAGGGRQTDEVGRWARERGERGERGGGGASKSRTPAARVSMSERMFHVKHSVWAR